MSDKPDPLIETLMQLAASAAPLVRRARESGLFTPPAPSAPPTPPEAPPAEPAPPADIAALQAIVVRQALRIAELEAELEAAKPRRKRTK
ncbi:hypothetical protein [Polymorphobacter sp.]|uniref:hypothetical protein n=1 Tax=Polymorphobacter sp. TaxID=1909290 RepID=UPI003F720A8A